MELKRERKLDLNSLPPDQVDAISKQIGEKIKQICDKACEDANRILNVYGMSSKMQIVIDHPDLKKPPVQMPEPAAPAKKRGRPRKASQSLT